MKVASSQINLAAEHFFTEKDEKQENLQVWFRGRSPIIKRHAAGGSSTSPDDKVSLTPMAKSALAAAGTKPKTKEVESVKGETDDFLHLDRKLFFIKKLVERLTGHKIKVFDCSELNRKHDHLETDAQQPQAAEGNTVEEGWGLSYDRQEFHYEHESLDFAAEGIVKTADGKEITFSIQLQMSREYASAETFSLRAGDAARKIDPLVMNFDGAAAELSNMKFSFDLDANGEEEQVSFVSPGSGFLALDVNNDGVINDGSELFGPKTGNGFAELAAYDEDGNNWIDENDFIYDRLSIWTKDSQGIDHLVGLQQSSVGAVYLSAVNSPFDLRDETNTLHGQVKKSGIYLEEDGTAKSIQQIDLTT